MTADGFRCSDAARARHEPLSATASLVTAWLLVEQTGAWGPDALFDSGLPAEVAMPLQYKATGLGIRIVLVRRTSRRDREPVAILVHSGGGGRRPTMFSDVVPDPMALLDLDLESLAAGRPFGFGRPIDHPIYLVCTHGRHDICCADKGRPLFRAMSRVHPERVWESSHIGGDRFAGNLVVLPRGDYFGRLDPEHAGSLMAGYDAGRLDLDHHRGTSTRPRMVQAAEYFLRSAESLTGLDDVEPVDYRRPSRHHAEVVLRGLDGGHHLVRVRARTMPESAQLTCRAEQPGHAVEYDLLSIESTGIGRW